MSKRHVNRHKSQEDAVLMSSVDEVEFAASMVALDRREAKRMRRMSKTTRNRFDDYEEEKWHKVRSNHWKYYDSEEDELDFND